MFDTAREIEARLKSVPEVGQMMIKQVAGYPTLNINVDRTKAARLGITERSVITNLITALNSNSLDQAIHLDRPAQWGRLLP